MELGARPYRADYSGCSRFFQADEPTQHRQDAACLRPASLSVAGQVPLIKRLEGLENRVELLGWVKDPNDFYSRIRLLVYPAKLEAYGMVVAEALARRIPVLVSEATSASADMGAAGRALPHTAPVQPWARAARELLAQLPEEFPPVRSWAEVAEEYHLLYQGLTL